MSASAARQRFGAVLKAALREPVFIRRQNRDMSVIISLDTYKRMCRIDDTEFERLIDRTGDDRPR
ncbi:MAG: type II toxin-antitoxin system Phd/YefM family antitoxin [Candidatus Sulfotelmatobacter sp.]